MLIWAEKENHLRIGDADNGWPLYDFICIAPQNEEDLVALKNFIESCGYSVDEVENAEKQNCSQHNEN